ncbi:DUF4810 domain-containing protein [Hyphomonas oceanitis]|uniref:DUF4810 domain-containing protein n=1 Tax=Hyphomonas oceanitis TaxID=81033 RepID=UPI003003975C
MMTGALALGLAACATPPRFEYGAYEPTLYAFYKKPEMREKFETALEAAIEKGEASDRLAPGLYAELGYLRLDQGDQAAAIQLFEKEASAFPESAYFMNGVVNRLKGIETPTEPEVVEATAEDKATVTETIEVEIPAENETPAAAAAPAGA